jgi:predicted DNA-binding protein
MQKTRLNIYLNPQQKDKLDKLSTKTGAPMSELVRRAIELYLKKET